MKNQNWYWTLLRLLFFFNQRTFSLLSFLLLDNGFASHIRVALLCRYGVQAGKNCAIRHGIQFQEGFRLILGDNVFINAACLFDTSAPISLGNDVQVAYQVTFVTGGHQIGNATSRAGAHHAEPITVGHGAWIGARATILPGVTIGAGTVVAAGAVVVKDVPPHSVVAGVPAKVMRLLDE